MASWKVTTSSREVTTAQARSCCWPEGFVCEAGGSGQEPEGRHWCVRDGPWPSQQGLSSWEVARYFDQMIGFA